MRIDFKNIRVLGYLTLFGFGILGLVLVAFIRDEPILEFLWGYYSIPVQLLTGCLYGLLCGYLAWYIVIQDFMWPIRQKYGGIIQNLNLTTLDIWLLSFCAGVGEELFFRGGLQPLLGIWLTAIIFVAIHGYLNPKNWRISIYGLAMCFIIAGLGYLTEHAGILSAATAHMMIDVVLLKRLSRGGE